eukprot:Pgem_evm1s4409
MTVCPKDSALKDFALHHKWGANIYGQCFFVKNLQKRPDVTYKAPLAKKGYCQKSEFSLSDGWEYKCPEGMIVNKVYCD